jgi:hypothetical protein
MLVEVEERLRFNHRDLIGIGGERVDVQLCFSRFEIDVAEGLQPVNLKLGEPDENAAVPAEPFEVGEALFVESGVETLDLKIGHIADAPAEGAFVRAWAAELESLDETSFGKGLSRGADNLGKARVIGENADNVGAAGNPDEGLVFFGFKFSACVDIE